MRCGELTSRHWQSSRVWKIWRDFEMDLLKVHLASSRSMAYTTDIFPCRRTLRTLAPGPWRHLLILSLDSPDQLVQVEQLYLERLKVPHLGAYCVKVFAG